MKLFHTNQENQILSPKLCLEYLFHFTFFQQLSCFGVFLCWVIFFNIIIFFYLLLFLFGCYYRFFFQHCICQIWYIIQWGNFDIHPSAWLHVWVMTLEDGTYSCLFLSRLYLLIILIGGNIWCEILQYSNWLKYCSLQGK